MPTKNHGPERRQHLRCHLDDRVHQLERDLRAITHCLNGYKSFIEVLKHREEQKIKFRETIIEKGLTSAMLTAAGGAAMVLWYAAAHWVKGP